MGYITWHPYTTIEGLKATAKWLQYFAAPPKLIGYALRVEPVSPITIKIEHDGLLVSKEFTRAITDRLWVFQDTKVSVLYDFCMEYHNIWLKARDGIRLIEKYVSVEKKKSDIDLPAIIAIRLEMDKEYWSFFNDLLLKAEDKSLDSLASYCDSICDKYKNSLEKLVMSLEREHFKDFIIKNGLFENYNLLSTTSSVSRYRKG